ncbi:MAG: hypothetical protein AB7N54_16950 [Alphaproteobacteria bacterium]
MKLTTLLRGTAAATLCIAVAACGSVGDDTPARYGLYADDDGDLVRLDGDEAWERATWSDRSDLEPDVTFVVYSPGLSRGGMMGSSVRLQRVASVRRTIGPKPGIVEASQTTQWYPADDAALDVPVDFGPYDDVADAISVIPRRPLEPGLYSLQVETTAGKRTARVGIGWSRVDRLAYAERYCVDRYRTDSDTIYLPCRDEAPGAGLDLALDRPVQEKIAGATVMVVRGEVRNPTPEQRPVPQLVAQLRATDGTVLKEWLIVPPTPILAPNESVAFRSTVDQPPTGVTTVHVNFARQTNTAAAR